MLTLIKINIWTQLRPNQDHTMRARDRVNIPTKEATQAKIKLRPNSDQCKVKQMTELKTNQICSIQIKYYHYGTQLRPKDRHIEYKTRLRQS